MDVMDIYYSGLKGTDTYVVLQIDTSKIKKGTKFYLDQRYGKSKKGIWTYSNIPPEAIKYTNIKY